MLIIIDKPGQLCNRLWTYAPFINDAIENDYKILIIHFYDYYEYFEDLKVFKNIKFLKREKTSLIYRIIFKILSKIPQKILSKTGIFYNLDGCLTKNKLQNKMVMINGWSYKKPYKHLKQNIFLELFKPKNKYITKVDKLFLKKRKTFDIIVGVHIRRGDYKEFMNGAYLYTDTNYINYINQLKKQFDTSKKITFLLCSNNKINTEVYIKDSFFQINNANLIEDLYGLSKCDYIIGPPSTFSMWASFYGQKPLKFLTKSNLELKLEDFNIIIAQNKFDNGDIFSH